MPPGYGFGQDEKETFLPQRPVAACHDPEELVEWAYVRSRVFALQNDELLAEGKVLKHQATPTAKAANEGSEAEPKRVKQWQQSYSRTSCRPPSEVVDFKAGRSSDEEQKAGL